ncbi:MAG: HEAT repeat domain-containing protein [Planctomycetota bacterium]|nr:MAG: HEAT repeat domain-containing protein [Planctomycetota bacterium]
MIPAPPVAMNSLFHLAVSFLCPVAVVVALAIPARAVDLAVDQAQQLDPLVVIPAEVVAFSKKLLPLWQQALDRPDVEPRRLAIDTITLATTRGMKGLEATVPRLVQALRDEEDPQLRRAAAGALVALDAAEAAADLASAAEKDGLLMAQIVEPSLAKWNHSPWHDVWLERLLDPDTQPGLRLLAIDAVGTVQEARAAAGLEQIVADSDTSPDTRLAAARALGKIRAEGLVDFAAKLADSDAGGKSGGVGSGALGRLLAVALLARQSGDAVVDRLVALCADPEPAVATGALVRLDEIAPVRALDTARGLLAVPDAGLRARAARIVSGPGDADCIHRLGPLLADRNPALRRFVASTLADFGATPGLLPAVVEEGTAMLAGDQWRGLEQAALLLGSLDHEPAAERLLQLLDHPRDEVAVSAAWALRKLEVPATLAPLLAYATALRSQLQKQLSIEVITKFGQQAQQIHQLFGILRYREAEPLLREYVPKSQIDVRARSAAYWALGLFHEDEPDCDLAPVFAERLADVATLPPEAVSVRWMAAVGLGRFKAESQLKTLREFAPRDTMFLETGIACYWSIWRITGEEMPPEPLDAKRIGGWFLELP